MDNTPFNWTCPHCYRPITITKQDIDDTWVDISRALNGERLFSRFIVCPNPECKGYTLFGELSIRGALKTLPLVFDYSIRIF